MARASVAVIVRVRSAWHMPTGVCLAPVTTSAQGEAVCPARVRVRALLTLRDCPG